MEPYITAANPAPLTDGLVELLLRLVVEYLPRVLNRPDDIDGRTQLSWLSTIGCSGFTSLGGGGGAMTLHGIEHSLSGYYDIAHGDGLAALLPAWMRYTHPARQDRFRALGEKVFGRPDGILATGDWLKETGMRLRLREMAVLAEHFQEMASTAAETAPWLKYHPRPLGADVIAQIYQDAY